MAGAKYGAELLTLPGFAPAVFNSVSVVHYDPKYMSSCSMLYIVYIRYN